MWNRLEVDGVEWEVRAVAQESVGNDGSRGEEVLEFRALDNVHPPRRVALPRGESDTMDEQALRSAFGRARPIGGDFYGRPGKRMTDVQQG